MCGILGSIRSNIELNLDLLKHRGPDNQGFYQDKDVWLGHTRLSIQDLSHHSNQPMRSDDGRYILIFNGEIYNHQEIRTQLDQINFRTNGDTETVLNSLIFWGENALNKFNGIFALAFYDNFEKRILLARDRFGVKPLYFYKDSESFIFASELKAFVNHIVDPTLNINALEKYIRFLWCPGEDTPINEINKLLPGHKAMIQFTSEKLKVNIAPYHDFKNREDKSTLSETELIDQLDSKLQKAVRRQLLSDVPVGFFLSGGLDSTLLVAIARKLMPEKEIVCFTIDTRQFSQTEGFSNDLEYAMKAAKDLNVTLEIVKADESDLNFIDTMVWHLDEPQADAAPNNVLKISRKAKEMGFSVLIGGTAGDDLFSGYRRHHMLKVMKWRIPSFLIEKILTALIKFLPSSHFRRRISKLLTSLKEKGLNRIFSLFEWLPYDMSKNLFINKRNISRFNFFNSIIRESKTLQDFTMEDFLTLERRSFLVDHNLNYTDKMGMAAGIEIRVPFLDNDLVDFAGSIPDSFKMHNGESKYILKKVAERYLSKDIIYRKKSGFGAPVRKWVKEDLEKRIDIDLDSNKLSSQGIFDVERVNALIKENKKGKIDASYSILGLLLIQSWMNQFKIK